jgi:hypothetical protein
MLAGRLDELYVVPFDAGAVIVSVGLVVSMRMFLAFASEPIVAWPVATVSVASLPATSRIVPPLSALADAASSRAAVSPGWTV